jgi:predicted alpha/beta superfamily hydrolase
MKNSVLLFVCFFFAKSIFGQNTPEALEMRSAIFNGTRKLKVYLPSDYHNFPNRKYNVIFLFDAQSKPFLDYTKATLDYLSSHAYTYISPVILVGIEALRSRQFEFLPLNKTDQPFKDYSSKVKLGGADSLALSLQEEIIPFIHSQYRCTEYRMGIGHSLGGSFVTYALMKYPQIFNAAIAISPNFYYDNEQLLTLFDSLSTGPRLNKKFLYIAYSKGDKLEERFRPSTVKMNQLLQKKKLEGFNWQVEELESNSHALTPIDGIYRGIIKYNKGLTASDEQIETFYKESRTPFIDQLKAYYQQRADKTGMILPTIEDITHVAYNLFYANKKKDALATLEWALSLYSNDTNLYDSIAEMYQDDKNNKEALLYYSKGIEIVEREKTLLPPKVYQDKVKWFSERIDKVKSQN